MPIELHPTQRASAVGRDLLHSLAHGATAGATCGLFASLLAPGAAELIAAQGDPVLARALICFLCVQMGVAVALMIAGLDRTGHGEPD